MENFSANDARFAQTVAVEPDTLYHIRCVCRAEDIGDAGAGATISVKDTFCYSNAARDTNGQWQTLELYGRTGANQTELTLLVRVGGYSSESAGRAWFDAVEMTAVDSAPAGAVVEDLAPVSGGSGGSDSGAGSDASAETAPPERNTEMYVLFACLYLLAVLAVARKYRRAPGARPPLLCRRLCRHARGRVLRCAPSSP